MFLPAWLFVRFVVAALTARQARQAEYDAAAGAAGYGPGLIWALTQLAVWEPPRTGWEDVITGPHPPIQLRIDALQP